MAKALDLDFRRELFSVVQAYPGLHLRELARQLGTSVALVEYHLPVLVEAELIALEEDRYVRVFPMDVAASNREWIGVLREEHPTRIALLLLNEGPKKHGDICIELEMGKSKASFHLKKMRNAGMIGKDGADFVLTDPKRVTQILVKNKPTSDALSKFSTLWANFYSR